ncbi:hypothetical protein BY458DRAFT_526285 [Sporodiniella umbellata]|nr:hypothetical protein BY458DRAFT_526285 [Sporodiniella umbellata]
MSFILRPTTKTIFNTCLIKRSAHKKANIQVRMNQYVEGVGRKGEVVAVRAGLMRNILYPTGKARYAQKGEESEIVEVREIPEEERRMWEEVERGMVDKAQKQELEQLRALKDVSVIHFSRAVIPNSENTFGSVTLDDIVSELKKAHDITVDKSAVQIHSEGGRIKSLGSHSILVQIAEQSLQMTVKVDSLA